MTQTKGVLLQDIIGIGKSKTLYGKETDPVIIIDKRDNVWLVTNPKNGESFSINPKKVKEIK